MKKRRRIGFGVKTRSSGGFGRSSGCIKSQSRELRARAAHPGARAGVLSVEDPLEREKSPRERLRRIFQDRDFPARAAASPLERPVSKLTPFSLSEMGFSHGLIFYPKLPLIILLFICFILRILFSLLCLMGFYL